MNANVQGMVFEGGSARFWRFADCEFDELARQLWVNGGQVVLDLKPLEVLLHLLVNAGEVVTKEELLEAVWLDEAAAEGSLTAAIAKLRKAIGEEEHSIIATVPRVGYRLAVPVFCKMFAEPVSPIPGLKADAPVPNLKQWQLKACLDASGSNEVWLAGDSKSGEDRVFKFAADENRLKSLKHEIAVYRYLRESLGDRPDVARILEWNQEVRPYFIEREHAGPDLVEWSKNGALASMTFSDRLKLALGMIQTVADAHSVGILHKDLKPANILAVPRFDGGWQTKIADFGSASLCDRVRLNSLGIVNLGFNQSVGADSPVKPGAAMYVAPEILASQSFTAAADVYSLGMILYQTLVADFKRTLEPGWEEEIDEPLIREDIAAAVSRDPAKRIASAMELVERLRDFEDRNTRRELDNAKVRAANAERKLAATRLRRPWIAAMMLALTAGLLVSVIQYSRTAKERDIATREKTIAGAVNAFLSEDLIGRSDPFASGVSDESLVEAIHQAMPNIDQEYQSQPLVAARLHQTLARAFDNRADFADARAQYARSAELFHQAEGDLSQDGIIVQLQRASLEARSSDDGSLPLAKSIAESQQKLIGRVAEPRPELQVWNASARATIALSDNDPKSAAMLFEEAVDKSSAVPQFDERARLTLKERLALCYVRMGDGARGEQLDKELITDLTRSSGPDSPNVLRARLNLVQAYATEKKHSEALKEANAIYPDFVSRLGPNHQLSMQLLTTRAHSEVNLGLWKDAIRDDLAINAVAVKDQGPQSLSAIATLSDAALAECRGGRVQEGEKNARSAYEASVKAFGAHAGVTGGTEHTLASCLTQMNQLNDASWLLSQVNVPAVAQLDDDPDFGARVKLVQADIASRLKDDKRLKALLDQIGPVFTRGDAETYEKQLYETLFDAEQGIAHAGKLMQDQAVIVTGVKPAP